MKTSTKVYNAVISLPSTTLISVEDISKKIGTAYFETEQWLRILAKDNFIHLAAICAAGNTPTMGVFEGKAKQKEYYFAWSNLNKKFEE
jgi:hypothetical protein